MAVLLPIYIENSEKIDDAIYTYYRAPSSYTGEDIIEICCHGNPVIVGSVVDRLCHYGARLADPGEYTKRAFINGKMDLVQAESVGLLISARSKDAVKHQGKNLSGVLSKSISLIRDDLLFSLSSLEYELDISDNDSGIDGFLKKSLKTINSNILRVKDFFKKPSMPESLSEISSSYSSEEREKRRSSLINDMLFERTPERFLPWCLTASLDLAEIRRPTDSI
jgi:tRNA U34 5-carboxymethylaminomethyl modifying GTPase MnmE/TrmE